MPEGNILVVEDDQKNRLLLKRILTMEGYTIHEAVDLKSASYILKREDIDVIICDVRLPDGNGIDFISRTKISSNYTEIILLTAFGNIQDGVQAMRNGAFDYITKGDDNEKIVPLLNRAIEKIQLEKRVERLEQQVGKRYRFENILGQSNLIKE